ncbi:hypothetical protein V8F06_012373 [Rhypophila decipiens]
MTQGMGEALESRHNLPEKANQSNRLAGKVVLVTGGTAGLGAESAVALARHGAARIYITGRGRDRGTEAKPAGHGVIARIEQEYDEYLHQAKTCPDLTKDSAEEMIPPRTEIIFLPMDLSCLSSVSAAAAERILTGDDTSGSQSLGNSHQKAKPRLDILLCNAGIAAVPYSVTASNSATTPGEIVASSANNGDGASHYTGTKTVPGEGYEIQFATNFLGHALLIRKLLPLLRQSVDGRIISVTSFAFRMAGMLPGFGLFALFDGFQIPTRSGEAEQCRHPWIAYDAFGLGAITRWLRYAESKLAMMIYTRELARRYPDVTSVSVTPGFVATRMVKHMSVADRLGTHLLAGITWALGINGEGSRGMVGPAGGAENQVWACLASKEALRNGGLYDPVGVICDDEKLGRHASDHILGERLWSWTRGAVQG